MKEKERLVYFNDEFIPERDARISIFDSALMFGDMVFEITCSFNKVQFKLDEHIKRLYSGIKMLEIPLEMNPEEMEQIGKTNRIIIQEKFSWDVLRDTYLEILNR